jgi:hypothetical protein
LPELFKFRNEDLHKSADKSRIEFSNPANVSTRTSNEHQTAKTAGGSPENAAGINHQSQPFAAESNQTSPRQATEVATATEPPQPAPVLQAVAAGPITVPVRSDLGTERPLVAQNNPAQDPAPALANSAAQTAGSNALAGVQVARIVERVGQTEMHIGMRTQAFGSVDVHTALHDAQVGLALNSEKGDLKASFVPELPGLHAILREQDLRLLNLSFASHPGADLSGRQGSHSDGHTAPSSASSFRAEAKAHETSTETEISTNTRVNVHA